MNGLWAKSGARATTHCRLHFVRECRAGLECFRVSLFKRDFDLDGTQKRACGQSGHRPENKDKRADLVPSTENGGG